MVVRLERSAGGTGWLSVSNCGIGMNAGIVRDYFLKEGRRAFTIRGFCSHGSTFGGAGGGKKNHACNSPARDILRCAQL